MRINGSRADVFHGKAQKTRKGLERRDLMKNRRGKIVSKKAAARGMYNPWIAACNAARMTLNIQGFAAIKRGSAIYKKAMEFKKIFQGR